MKKKQTIFKVHTQSSLGINDNAHYKAIVSKSQQWREGISNLFAAKFYSGEWVIRDDMRRMS